MTPPSSLADEPASSHHPAPVLAIILLALVTHQTLLAQTSTPTTPADPRTLVQHALDRLHEADTDRARFTYTERLRTITLDPQGRRVFDAAYTYETTFIGGRPYSRMTQIDDKPLTGKDLEKEQKLYDEAVAKQKNLGDMDRMKTSGFKVVEEDFQLDYLLGPQYAFTQIGHGMANDELEYLIDAHLTPGATPQSKCPWHVRLWISDKDGIIRRFVTDVPNDQTAFCHDASSDATYTLIDGFPKLARWTERYFYHPKSLFMRETSLDDATYTNYKRFRTTVTIHSANGEVHDDTTSPAPTPQPAPNPPPQ